MEETRRHKRTETDEPAYVSSGGSVMGCIVRNISPEGAAIDVDNPAFVPARFHLVMARDHTVHDCQVVWIRGNRIGLSFIAVPQRDTYALQSVTCSGQAEMKRKRPPRGTAVNAPVRIAWRLRPAGAQVDAEHHQADRHQQAEAAEQRDRLEGLLAGATRGGGMHRNQ